MQELVRVFVAVKLPGNITDELENFLSELRPLANIRWVKKDNMHITLKFLGELPGYEVDDIREKLSQIKYFPAFDVELSYIGAFPNLNSPRVLWLSGDKGKNELVNLAAKVNDILELPKEKYTPHLTLARLKDYHLPEVLVRKLGTVKTMRFSCGELFLMRSVLTPKGPVYSVLL